MEKLIIAAILIYGIWWVLKRSQQAEYDKRVDLIVFAFLLGLLVASSF